LASQHGQSASDEPGFPGSACTPSPLSERTALGPYNVANKEKLTTNIHNLI